MDKKRWYKLLGKELKESILTEETVYKTQSGKKYTLDEVPVIAKGYGNTVGFVPIDENGKPARSGDGVWVFPNEICAREYIKKWR